MKKCFLRCLFLVALALALSVSSNAFGAEAPTEPEVVEVEATPTAQTGVTVTTNADSGEGSFRDAVEKAEANGTVLFDGSLNGAKIQLSSPIVLEKSLTIDASSLKNSVMIVADGGAPALKIGGGDIPSINIIGVRVTGNANGELVSVSGANLSMENCQIIANKNGRGMTAAKDSTTISLTNCTIGGNNNKEEGGGLHIGAGAVVKLEKCVIATNASAKDGGGIFIAEGASVEMNECTITRNTAVVDGGGIRIVKGTLTVDKSSITANKAKNGGGYADSGKSDVKNSLIAQNIASEYGGGMGVWAGESTLSDSIVASNLANSDAGGIAIWKRDNQPSSMKINGCSISGNVAQSKNSAVWIYNGIANIKNSTIAKNSGGIYANGNTQIEYCTIADNKGVGLHIGGGQYILKRSIVLGNETDVYGGNFTTESTHNVLGKCTNQSVKIPSHAAKLDAPKDKVLAEPVRHETIFCAGGSEEKIPLYYPLLTAKNEFSAIDLIPAEEYLYEFDEVTDQLGNLRPVGFFGSENDGDAGAIEMQLK